MTEIVLRPDQWKLKFDILCGWNSGRRNVLGVLPTGGGKSVIVSDIVRDDDSRGLPQAVIAHRVELVSQMAMHVARRGIYHRIIAPKPVVSAIMAEQREEFGRSYVNPSARCAVTAVDTLLARSDELVNWAHQIQRWTIDEAHHVLRQNKWGKAVAMFPNAFGLGVTATPLRADGMGLGSHHDGVFDYMAVGPSTRELMNLGAITDYEYAVAESDFQIDDDAITASGDFSQKKMAEASKRSHLVGDVVKEYMRLAFGKRGITFAIDVEDAMNIAQRFNDAGIPAAAVSAKTPTVTRSEMIRRFRDGRLMQLVNVDLFGEGFDVPAVEVVSMARPTASLAVFLQQAGRALRALSGKTHGLIIDHVSNYKRHGFPDKPRMWTLDRRDRKKRDRDPEEIELSACKACGRPYERVLVCCPHCGHVPQPTERDRQSIDLIDGDLILLDRQKLAELRAAAELESAASVASRAGFVAGPMAAAGAANRQTERIQAQQRLEYAIALWAGQQRALNRPDQESYRRFYMTAGIDVLSARALPRAEMDALRERIEGWIR